MAYFDKGQRCYTEADLAHSRLTPRHVLFHGKLPFMHTLRQGCEKISLSLNAAIFVRVENDTWMLCETGTPIQLKASHQVLQQAVSSKIQGVFNR